MKKKSKLESAIAAFREAGGILTMSEAMTVGIHRRELYALRDRGDLEVISRGLYRLIDMPDPSLPDFIPVAKKIPHGVICLISALCYYGLTDEIMREFWIAVPHATTSPSRENTHIIRMRNSSFGQTTVKIGKRKINIFNQERTIVDAFRYLDKETALKSLQTYLKVSKERKPDIDKLLRYAKKLRVDLISYISALTL